MLPFDGALNDKRHSVDMAPEAHASGGDPIIHNFTAGQPPARPPLQAHPKH